MDKTKFDINKNINVFIKTECVRICYSYKNHGSFVFDAQILQINKNH